MIPYPRAAVINLCSWPASSFCCVLCCRWDWWGHCQDWHWAVGLQVPEPLPGQSLTCLLHFDTFCQLKKLQSTLKSYTIDMNMWYTYLAHQEPESINLFAIICHKQCRCAYQQREQDRYVVLICICYSCYIHTFVYIIYIIILMYIVIIILYVYIYMYVQVSFTVVYICLTCHA